MITGEEGLELLIDWDLSKDRNSPVDWEHTVGVYFLYLTKISCHKSQGTWQFMAARLIMFRP